MTTRTITVEALEAALDVGIYPKSSPDGERTPWQDGWNAAVMEIGDRVDAALPVEPAVAERGAPNQYSAEPAGAGLHRQADELGHVPGGAIFHLDVCARCGLMLAYLVRDQVACLAAAPPAPAGLDVARLEATLFEVYAHPSGLPGIVPVYTWSRARKDAAAIAAAYESDG